MQPWIAATDLGWFDFLRGLGDARGRVDEVNFWNPSGEPMRSFTPGEPVFFRLGKPRFAIGGYGFFAHFTRLRLDKAWELFEEKNGALGPAELLDAIAGKRRMSNEELMQPSREIGCTILRDAVFWPENRWIPWREDQGWAHAMSS